ncbi:unannotated protein [freshwater metagenome]|uniref:Unannotated protein n=1 Tax=freshwater metagenome TaxID=449393 RepID=A0A6J7F530_9ZZZZ
MRSNNICTATNTVQRLRRSGNGWHVLTGENKADRAMLSQGCVPGASGFVCISGANNGKSRHRPKAPKMFNRLMSWPIFAQANRVMSPHESHRCLHQCRKTHGTTHVVAEHKEGAAERTREPTQRHSIQCSTHSVFANAVMDDASIRRCMWHGGGGR